MQKCRSMSVTQHKWGELEKWRPWDSEEWNVVENAHAAEFGTGEKKYVVMVIFHQDKGRELH